MSVIEWNEELETGNDVVDDQHKEIIGMVNKLHEAIISRESNEVLFETLEALAKYTEKHFLTEEGFMRDHEYPGLEQHQIKHNELNQQAAQIIEDYRSGKYMLSLALSSFLGSWVRHHIFEEDMEMVQFIKAKNKGS